MILAQEDTYITWSVWGTHGALAVLHYAPLNPGSPTRCPKTDYVTISKQLQNAIETCIDFKTTIQDDPIKLLKTIKIVMHKPERSKYPYTSITEAL